MVPWNQVQMESSTGNECILYSRHLSFSSTILTEHPSSLLPSKVRYCRVFSLMLLYFLQHYIQLTFCKQSTPFLVQCYSMRSRPGGGMPLVADVGSLLLYFTFLSDGPL